MPELKTRKIHAAGCTADRPSAALAAFVLKFPNYCADCRATGRVVRSGMELPCGRCMNGNWRCPRCAWRPDNRDFWPGRCGFCLWSGAADGAPLADCDCPEEITIERIAPTTTNKAKAARDKRSRLEELAGVNTAAAADVDRDEKPKTKRQRDAANERRQTYGDNRDERDFDNRIAED